MLSQLTTEKPKAPSKYLRCSTVRKECQLLKPPDLWHHVRLMHVPHMTWCLHCLGGTLSLFHNSFLQSPAVLALLPLPFPAGFFTCLFISLLPSTFHTSYSCPGHPAGLLTATIPSFPLFSCPKQLTRYLQCRIAHR